MTHPATNRGCSSSTTSRTPAATCPTSSPTSATGSTSPTTAPAALELVRQRPYDVALLDLRMPGMDGLTLYREIKKLRAGTVAILVTAYASGATSEEALAAGAWQVLPKPVDLPRLLDLVDRAQRPAAGPGRRRRPRAVREPLGHPPRAGLPGRPGPRRGRGGRAAPGRDLPGRPDRHEAAGRRRRRGVPPGPGGGPGGPHRPDHRLPPRDGRARRRGCWPRGPTRPATSRSTCPGSWTPSTDWPRRRDEHGWTPSARCRSW